MPGPGMTRLLAKRAKLQNKIETPKSDLMKELSNHFGTEYIDIQIIQPENDDLRGLPEIK